jgi:hypothetical protein
VHWQVAVVATLAHTRVVSAAPTQGVQTVTSWNTRQLLLPAAATSTACSWKVSTFFHAGSLGASKK